MTKMDTVLQETSIQSSNFEQLTKDMESVNTVTEQMSKDIETQATEVQSLGNRTTDLKQTVDSLIPETDITKMTLSDAKAYRVNESNMVLAEFLEAHPIESTCHGGKSAHYSITKDKQNYLQAMILTTQMAMQAGVEYQPSWNATGEPCTYDWTLAELQQLAFEIESVVRPLVSAQQKIEASINACKTIDELKEIVISYKIGTPVTPSVITPATPDDTTTTETTDETAEEVVSE